VPVDRIPEREAAIAEQIEAPTQDRFSGGQDPLTVLRLALVEDGWPELSILRIVRLAAGWCNKRGQN